MIETKFRFWNIIDKCFVKANGWCSNYTINEIFKDLKKYNLIAMQWTGLKDKNKKEIYEGDICKIFFKINDIEDYIYNSLTEEEKKNQSKIFLVYSPIFNNQPELNVDPENIEVIGNIYENPELLN